MLSHFVKKNNNSRTGERKKKFSGQKLKKFATQINDSIEYHPLKKQPLSKKHHSHIFSVIKHPYSNKHPY